ncbi:amino acid permease ScVBA-like protein [Pleurotus eryngii]|uniref:Amino acid permease ScVBA-like protein n=1 Tax=Pleurotus eryngii TaxID=5323 RepID=A0A9P6A4J2_PLEER|nr:amino acid permease ScVBA-like protein [Pleurotus eryngii]
MSKGLPFISPEWAPPSPTLSSHDPSPPSSTTIATNPLSSTKSHRSSVHTLESTTSTILEDSQLPSLTTFRLLVAHIGAALTLFLATTDATIVSTCLPTIASDLKATQTEYTWVGVAYMLTQTACQPFYGRLSDIVGRKAILFSSMFVFALGSLLCGAAQNIIWLIVARGIAGIGGGGIVASVWVITSEIVEVRNRAKWSQALSVTWSCSAVAGPILGGVFSSGGDATNPLSWRWAFYLNLPVCLFGAVILFLSLHGVKLQSPSHASFGQFLRKFDFVGLVTLVAGTSCIIVGFSFGTDNGWTSPSTLLLIILGLTILIIGGVYEVFTKREALFPKQVFCNSTAIIVFILSFLHSVAFNAGTFYLALYFQAVTGASPLDAGWKLLPYSLGSSLASMPAAWFIGYWQHKSKTTSGQNMVISLGLIIATVGFGLMTLLDEHPKLSAYVTFPLLAGIGLGMLFHAPYQVFTRALKPSELASATSAFFLVRFTGATVGLAVAGAVFQDRTTSRFPAEISLQGLGSTMDFSSLNSIQPMELRNQVLSIVASSIQTIWTVCTPSLGTAALISLLLPKLPIDPGENVVTEEKTDRTAC